MPTLDDVNNLDPAEYIIAPTVGLGHSTLVNREGHWKFAIFERLTAALATVDQERTLAIKPDPISLERHNYSSPTIRPGSFCERK